MKKQMIFRYSGSISFSKMITKGTIIALILFMSILFIIKLLSSSLSIQDCLGLIFTIGVLALVSLSQPFWPDIKIDDEGLMIESFWKDLRLSWEEIIKVEEIEMPFNFKIWLIKTKGLTSFHRIYSLIYTYTFEPSFLIYQKMEGHEILISKLRQASLEASKLSKKSTAVKKKTG